MCVMLQFSPFYIPAGLRKNTCYPGCNSGIGLVDVFDHDFHFALLFGLLHNF